MMKVTLAALLALQATTSAFMVVPSSRPSTLVALESSRKGAASSREEDLMLTLKVIMDHAARSTTASKDQFISQMEEAATRVDDPPVDISIPYDAAAKLAYEAAGSPGGYAAFKTKFEADAVADVIAKKVPAPVAAAPAPVVVDISVPYDAAAKLAYEAAGSKGDYADFKAKFEADAVADVIAKKAPAPAAPAPVTPAAVDISVPYDAAAKLAYEAAGGKGDYAAFKAKFEADAVADVIAKKAPAPAAPAPVTPAAVDISVPYDAAAKLAYEAAGGKGDYAAFKAKFEADAVADVIAKQKKTEAVAA